MDRKEMRKSAVCTVNYRKRMEKVACNTLVSRSSWLALFIFGYEDHGYAMQTLQKSRTRISPFLP